MSRQQNRRVVITGMGAVTSLGSAVPRIWESVLDGCSGIGIIRQFDSSAFPVRIGSEVDLDSVPPAGTDVWCTQLSRSARFGVTALRSAWQDAGLEAVPINRWRAGMLVGASTFPLVEGNLPDPRQLLDGDGYNADAYLAICRARPELLVQRDIPSIATLMSAILGLRGPSLTVQSACTSATQALGEAFQMVRNGAADIVAAGGTDSMMSVICVTGFTLLGALSPRQDNPQAASRPFDARRDGFVLGEGAGLLILEESTHALARNARIYAEMIGYGSSSDGYRFTDIHPEGEGPVRCMRAALDDAGIGPEEVDYINAHGTSTPQNDRVETLAVKKVFGKHAYQLAISSTKSQLGHLICAAGGIECIFTALSLNTGVLPPTINLEYPDAECDLDYVPNVPRKAFPQIAISNSFGFGGQNGTLVLRRWD